eukprot:4211806-Lingulodinium_polyedra.AAC.1
MPSKTACPGPTSAEADPKTADVPLEEGPPTPSRSRAEDPSPAGPGALGLDGTLHLQDARWACLPVAA